MRKPSAKEVKGFSGEAGRQLLEGPLYTLGIRLYRLGVMAVSPFHRKASLMIKGRKETWKKLAETVNHNDRNIWVHAASLGEFEQGRPLIEELRRRHPEYKIVVTFFSPSGYEVCKNWKGADCVLYLPFDTPRNARKIIQAINPEKVFFVKYEIWRNLLRVLYFRQIPTYLISASFNPKQRFFRKGGGWYALWLKWFTRIFVQDELSRQLLERLGIDNSVVAGDTRLDRVTDIMNSTHEIPAIEVMRKKHDNLIVFGSSWEPDERNYFGFLREKRIPAVIAPHEFDDRRLARMREELEGLRVMLYTEIEDTPEKAADADVLILNTFGMLSSAYRYATLAYVGGGYGAGIHNILEAAVYGVPVLFGPRHQRFPEAQGLIDCGGGFSVSSESDTRRLLENLTTDREMLSDSGRKAGEYVSQRLGATRRILDTLTL